MSSFAPSRFLLALVAIATVVAGAAACAPTQRRLLHASRRAGLAAGPPTVTLSSSGEIAVTLPPCTITVREVYADAIETSALPCVEPMGEMQITSPWGGALRAPVSSPDAQGRSVARFTLQPVEASVDPLDPRTWPRGEAWRTWTVTHPMLTTPFVWRPTDADIAVLALAVGASVGVDASSAPVTVPPDVVVDGLRAAHDEILAGGETVLELTVTNRGQGPAYRLYALTRSSLPALQGVQFSIGKLAPGQTASRRVRVALAENVGESTAMLVLVFNEANGFAPANFSRRFPVKIVATAPRLAVTCKPAGDVHEVDAGESLRLRCTIRNDGGRQAKQVSTMLAIGGVARLTSAPIDLAPRTQATVELPVRIPTDAAIDQQVAIEVTASEPPGGQRATTTVMVTIRRPRVCPTGKLTRAEYRLKRAELERARAAGDLTADEFDRYDAELVGCLDE